VGHGDADLGAVLFGAAEGSRQAVGVSMWIPDRTGHDRTERDLRAVLGPDGFSCRLSTDATGHTELSWVLRGRGGNFGVVTPLPIRLHPVHEVCWQDSTCTRCLGPPTCGTASATSAAAHFHTIDVGQHQVQNDDVWSSLGHFVERLSTTGGLTHGIAVRAERKAQRATDLWLIIDH